jgi:hypothetical protein
MENNIALYMRQVQEMVHQEVPIEMQLIKNFIIKWLMMPNLRKQWTILLVMM